MISGKSKCGTAALWPTWLHHGNGQAQPPAVTHCRQIITNKKGRCGTNKGSAFHYSHYYLSQHAPGPPEYCPFSFAPRTRGPRT
ncbi:hypothetical protein EVAR_26102_1 [Eumeta japonica]|uniref:Uncharacterized protein n=1 Tax=Eumeta variegata TaxID=151549 RepID=A0A4C1WXN9_EUMVA|nr:hypothetical protein EVAR_26102_1 [Eumeta japonica]